MSKKNGAVRFNHRQPSERPQSAPNGSTVEKLARPSGADVRQDSWVDTPADGAVDGPKGTAEPVPSEYEKKKKSIIERTAWTFVMLGIFAASLLAGHIYLIIIITAIQIISFKEVIAISNVPSRARSLRFTKSLNWYFLGTTMYFLYGESVVYYFKHIVLIDVILLPFATHHRFISFMLYVIGFVFFVTSLQKGHYKFQFTQFAWTHMALYLIVVQAHFVLNNILEGLIWLFLPAALVITNDIWAYICGMTFGRTPLIQLSPKKTLEGFLGAWVFTILFGLLFSNVLSRSTYFTCPVNDLGANYFTGLHCVPNPVFLPHTFSLRNPYLHPPLLPATITLKPIHLHVLVLGTFASLIAPFGGFFASGLKRTFKIKDFGDSIPGHGGMTDRMDCQFIMGFFTFMYYQSFVAEVRASVGGVVEMAVLGLGEEEIVEVVRGLVRYLVGRGALESEAIEKVATQLVLKNRG